MNKTSKWQALQYFFLLIAATFYKVTVLDWARRDITQDKYLHVRVKRIQGTRVKSRQKWITGVTVCVNELGQDQYHQRHPTGDVPVQVNLYQDALELRRVRVEGGPKKQKSIAKMSKFFDRCGHRNCTNSLAKREIERCNLQ